MYTAVVVEKVVGALLPELLVELFARGWVSAVPEVLSQRGPLHTCDGSPGAHENVLAAFALRPKCRGQKTPREANEEQNATNAAHDDDSNSSNLTTVDATRFLTRLRMPLCEGAFIYSNKMGNVVIGVRK